MPLADRMKPLENESIPPGRRPRLAADDEPDADLGDLWRDLGGGD